MMEEGFLIRDTATNDSPEEVILSLQVQDLFQCESLCFCVR